MILNKTMLALSAVGLVAGIVMVLTPPAGLAEWGFLIASVALFAYWSEVVRGRP